MPEMPDSHDLWHEVNQARLDIAELRGMVKMHFEDRQHHIPPCRPAAEMQKTIMSALAAAVIAMIGAATLFLVYVTKWRETRDYLEENISWARFLLFQ